MFDLAPSRARSRRRCRAIRRSRRWSRPARACACRALGMDSRSRSARFSASRSRSRRPRNSPAASSPRSARVVDGVRDAGTHARLSAARSIQGQSTGRPGNAQARAAAIAGIAAAAAEERSTLRSAPRSGRSRRASAELPGIGEWTAQYIAMRALGESDAFLAGDVGVQRKLASSDGERRRLSSCPRRALAALARVRRAAPVDGRCGHSNGIYKKTQGDLSCGYGLNGTSPTIAASGHR